jgi:hypothetical protein
MWVEHKLTPGNLAHRRATICRPLQQDVGSVARQATLIAKNNFATDWLRERVNLRRRWMSSDNERI